MEKKKIIIIITFLIMLASCSFKSRSSIEKEMSNFTNLYPTENLMDFFDKKGVITTEFDENDLGSWYLVSYVVTKENDAIKLEGMQLKLDRNTRIGRGYYDISITPKDMPKEQKKYYVQYDVNGITLLDEVKDEVLRNKILNFKFGVQYLNLDAKYIDGLSLKKKTYNSEVPLYGLTYNLKDNDENFQKIINRFPELIVSKKQIMEINGTDEKKDLTTSSSRELYFFLGEGFSNGYLENIGFNKTSLWQENGDRK